MCLLCPLPTGSPMTPVSWSVRRMLFGHSSHFRWLSCSRRWFAEYPRLYTLHPTLYTLRLTHVFPPSVMCTAVARRVFRVSVSIRVHPWAVYLPRHLLCFQYSRLFPFAPAGYHALVIPITSKSLPLHLTLYTLHQK